MASGMSAAMVSRSGLPLSMVSATAICSRLASMRSAIRFRMLARSVVEVRPHAALALCAASSAASMSLLLERGTAVNFWPLMGEMFSKYCPSTGATQCPPM